MATDAAFTEHPQILSGWKDIARYLGRGVRTVQRYEKELALPVYRPAGKLQSAVMASRKNIDAWMRARHSGTDDDVGCNYDSLRDKMIQFQKNCTQMRELRTALRASIATLQSSIQNVSLRRSSSRFTPNVIANSSSNS